MKTKNIVKLSFISMTQRGVRSLLTVLGIVLGIASIISLLSIGEGAKQSIAAQLGTLGQNVMTITPGFQRAEQFGVRGGGGNGGTTATLTDKDILAIKNLNGIQAISPVISGRADSKYFTEKASLSISGISPLAWAEATPTDLSQGRYLTPADAGAVVIGNNVASIFTRPLAINSEIQIGGRMFKVAGILADSGFSGGTNNAVFMTLDNAKAILNKTDYSRIDVKAMDSASMDELINNTQSRLMVTRHVSGKTRDFTVSSQAAVAQRITSVTGTFDLLLAGIASISLLVGALGIANTMYMSVIERTKQIGLMKALGSTSFEIRKLFLFESAFIGFIGGLLGVFLGFIVAGIISSMGVSFMGLGRGTLTPVITPQLILFAVLFSTIIGTISGILPAGKAAKLQPIEALRYE